MDRDRVEEGLLALVALAFLLTLAPLGTGAKIGAAAGVALALIALLVLRGSDWHTGGATPFDGILLAGIAVSIVQLGGLGMLSDSLLSRALLIVAAAFYASMAALLARHRGWLFHGRAQK